MRFSRESRYALIGLTALASKPPGTVISAGELAQEAELPAPFMAKIFHRLTRHGILMSHRGRQRGYGLSRPAEEISIREVLEAIDGADLFSACVFFGETCNPDNPCPLHHIWSPVKDRALVKLSEMSIAEFDFQVHK